MSFYNALISERKNINLPDEYNYFGKLIGDWSIEYIDKINNRSYKGEWHFAWILEGMAIQDVVILPDYEYGTTLRIYNPNSYAWDIAYCYTGKIMRLEAKKQDNMIILTHLGNEKRKWVFVKIEDTKFHWQDLTVKDDGLWHIDFEILAEKSL